MKYILSIFFILIFGVFSVPTFVEAWKEHKVYKTARIIAEDIFFARSCSMKEKNDHGLFFSFDNEDKYIVFIDFNKNKIYDDKDEVVKTVYLSDIYSDVIFSRWFKNKSVLFENDTIIFDYKGNSSSDDEKNSIFLIEKSDEVRQIKDRIYRVFVDNKNNSIKILRSLYVSEQDDVVFGQ